MTPPASLSRACILGVVAAALLSGCPPVREPLPSGLPPEYETPRSYEPDTNIDGAAAESDELPDDPPPPTAAPPAAAPAPAEPASAAPASAEPAPAEPAPAAP